MKGFLWLVSLLVFSAFAPAQICSECAYDQFGDAYCNNRLTSCGCSCYAINIGSIHQCELCGDCVLNQCIIECDNPSRSSLSTDQKLARDVATHPWIMDTTTADNIRIHSNAMAVVFEQMQQLIKDKHWTNARGWMSTTKGVPSDANGWVLYELISRDNGVSEIRLTYEKSHQQEKLLISPAKKWLLYRIQPDADHILHQENIAIGDIIVPEKKN